MTKCRTLVLFKKSGKGHGCRAESRGGPRMRPSRLDGDDKFLLLPTPYCGAGSRADLTDLIRLHNLLVSFRSAPDLDLTWMRNDAHFTQVHTHRQWRASYAPTKALLFIYTLLTHLTAFQINVTQSHFPKSDNHVKSNYKNVCSPSSFILSKSN